jgi:mono/diheme cytochrome c family protein
MTRPLNILGFVAAGCASVLLGQTATGDASRGEQLLRDRNCITCHKINGQGGNAAPDLGRRISRNHSPADVAAVMWNHASSRPARFGTFRLGESQAADLFAYFASRRYFEAPGDAARGKRVFAAKHCTGCHGISKPLSAEANPIAKWSALRNPIAFAQEMWNRPQTMTRIFARNGIRYPRLTSQEVNDLLVYLENLPVIRGREPRFQVAPPEEGRVVFQTKGCAGCHQGRLSLENRASRYTMAGVSAAMWNHALAGRGDRQPLSYGEMSGLVSYLWSVQGHGNGRRGKRIFARKRCIDCHRDAVPDARASGISIRNQSEAVPVSMITALGSHGPGVQAEMSRRGLAWPRFGGTEITDLVAYLETSHYLCSTR